MHPLWNFTKFAHDLYTRNTYANIIEPNTLTARYKCAQMCKYVNNTPPRNISIIMVIEYDLIAQQWHGTVRQWTKVDQT